MTGTHVCRFLYHQAFHLFTKVSDDLTCRLHRYAIFNTFFRKAKTNRMFLQSAKHLLLRQDFYHYSLEMYLFVFFFAHIFRAARFLAHGSNYKMINSSLFALMTRSIIERILPHQSELRFSFFRMISELCHDRHHAGVFSSLFCAYNFRLVINKITKIRSSKYVNIV